MEENFVFNAGNVVLQSGITFRDAWLAYQTYGKLNAEKIECHSVYDAVFRAPL